MADSRWHRSLTGLLLILPVLLLSGCISRSAATAGSDRSVSNSQSPEPSATPEILYHTVEFRQDDLTLSLQSVADGEFPTIPEDFPGSRLLGWTDENGRRVDPAAPVTVERVYHAILRPALKADSGWLLPRENGLLAPEEPFTFADALAAMETLLADPISLSPLTDGWAERGSEALPIDAFSALLEGLFAPDETAAVLDRVFPSGGGTVTRARAAGCLSHLLNAPARGDAYYPDAAPTHPDYEALMAAAAPGQLTREALAEKTQDGFLWFDGYLYRLDEDGYFICGEAPDGLTFGPGGRYTSGNEEIDGYVAQTLLQYTNDTLNRREKLRAVYLHVKKDFTYRVGNFHDSGETGWEIDEALTLYRSGKGNCYCYAGVFWSLARGLGYNAVTYSGTVGVEFQPHAWTEITLDGEVYICDPELEMNWWWVGDMRGDSSFYVDLFMLPRRTSAGWNYLAVGRS